MPSPGSDVPLVSHPISSESPYDVHSVPVPPPPRPPRPVKIPGYLLTAATHTEAQQWLEQQVFHTPDRTILQSIRQKQPIFLLDAQAQKLHGVFQRAQDKLQQDLTSPPGQHGYQVHVVPLYEFAVTLKLQNVDDLLVPLHQTSNNAPSNGSSTSSSSTTCFEPMLGSQQHGALWEAFMKAAKKQHQAMEAIQEEEQQQPQEGVPPPPSVTPAPAAANGHS